MELPEFMSSPVFWVKFGLIWGILVLLPIWTGMLGVMSSWAFHERILLSLAGGGGVMIALAGKTLGSDRK